MFHTFAGMTSFTLSSKLCNFFLETFSFLFEAISFAVWQKLIFENMTLKIISFLKQLPFASLIFSNLLKLDSFQRNFLLKSSFVKADTIK